MVGGHRGECDQCKRGNFSCCETTNSNRAAAKLVFGHTCCGMFGYTHITGCYAGGQAEYVRVPYADVFADFCFTICLRAKRGFLIVRARTFRGTSVDFDRSARQARSIGIGLFPN